MPNYKLSGFIQEEIKHRVKVICDRRLAYAQDGFPLTRAQIQAHCIEPEALQKLEWLKAEHIASLPMEQDPMIAFRKGLFAKRSVLVHAWVSEPLFARKDRTSFYYYGDELGGISTNRHNLIPTDAWIDPATLDPTTVGKVREWIEGVVRERRLRDMTNEVVEYMLSRHLPTSGHLLVRWPVLATLITDKEWRSRLRHPPVRTKQYAWMPDHHAALLEKLNPFLTAAEAVLLGGDMLAPYERNTDEVRGQVVQWERLPTDKVFKL